MARYSMAVACAFLLAVGTTALAEDPIKFEHDGEVFTIRPLPETDSCLEMSYGDPDTVVGYVGVWAEGTPERPFGYTTSDGRCGPEGFRPNNVGYSSPDEALKALAGQLLRQYRDNQGRREFDPKKEAEVLREFIKSIPPPAAAGPTSP